ncbi:MAG: efflux RND transporter permease subunit [Pirellulaceae bacterium]|nr:efflux RND transporter permease subunit [Pirellulaceae bacterium]
MKSLIRWAINNSPAMNTLLVAVLLVGGFSLLRMRREVFPEFELEIILISVPYPGASPAEVEEGICQKLEEAVASVDRIKKRTAVAKEGAGFLVLELESNVRDVQKVLNEVRSEIDRIPSFPDLAEDPEVKQITFRVPAIRVGVLGPDLDTPEAEWRLREVTEEVRQDLLQLTPVPTSNPLMAALEVLFPRPKGPVVSQANIVAAKDYQIDIEISERTLRKYGLSLRQVADTVRRWNLELPGGQMKTEAQDILLRGKSKSLTGSEIARIPLVTQPNGEVLTVGDLGRVQDAFADTTSISRIGLGTEPDRPGLAISVDRTSSEDLLTMVAAVKQYVARKNPEMPAGYQLAYWNDTSIDVEDRMNMLVRNGLQGLVLVFVVLALFLELRLAFWVALGVPIAVLGAGAVLMWNGETLNMLSMFAFLMALGIVVDDAIVIGENIYEHRKRNKSLVQAAIDGTYEVLPSVAASVGTTIIAFVPLMFVSGVMGKFIAVMPVAVIAMLIVSLIESTFVLPCHLAHPNRVFFGFLGFLLYPFRWVAYLFEWLNRQADRLLEFLIERTYVPTMRWALRYPATVLSLAAALLILAAGFVAAGIVPFVVFPKLDSRNIEAAIAFPDGTPAAYTQAATQRLEEAIVRVDQRLSPGKSMLVLRSVTVGRTMTPGPPGPNAELSGSHVGSVGVELVGAESREATSQQILDEWRKEAGQFPGAESVAFRSENVGPGGTPIEFKLLAPSSQVAQLEAAVEECKAKLASYQGVFDVEDDSRPGKWEYQLRIKDRAQAMGISVADLAETVRAAYYGDEVMRLQRGRHEVKLMVRSPENERRNLASFEDIRVRTGDGAERPLTELAEVTVERGYAEINRVDQMRAVTISADVDDSQGNAFETVNDMKGQFLSDLLARYPHVRVRWEGQQETTTESIQSLLVGFMIAAVAMFVLLTIEFRSYVQPLLILLIIPFGIIGAILGHALMGLDFTLFSLFGMIALTGVVVNDSIVLVDFINTHVDENPSQIEALIEAGRRRFRPVLLTSITTIAGLTPMLLETSFQAQVLVPMATSLCFGLLVATALVLVLVPSFYIVYLRTTGGREALPESKPVAEQTIGSPAQAV